MVMIGGLGDVDAFHAAGASDLLFAVHKAGSNGVRRSAAEGDRMSHQRRRDDLPLLA